MGKPVYQRSVEMAAEILGSADAVAAYLGIPAEEVLGWAQGRAEPAPAIVQRLVELIEEKTVNAARSATAVRSRRDESR